MTYKPRRERRARGGKAGETEPLHPEHGHQYNAQGSPEEKEESAESDGFKRGGMPKKKRKEGGHVEGHGAKHHLGKRARGGATAPKVEMHLGEHHEHKKGGEHHEEHKHHEEPERRARGGHVRSKHARGGAPFSAAHQISPPANDRKGGPGESAESIP